MDLNKLIEWAKETNNPEKIKKALLRMDPEGKNLRYEIKVLSYLGMIITKGKLIYDMQNKLNGYLADIEEYAEHLDKRGFRYAEKKEEGEQEQKPTGVLPQTEGGEGGDTKEEADKHNEEGKSKSTKIETVV